MLDRRKFSIAAGTGTAISIPELHPALAQQAARNPGQ